MRLGFLTMGTTIVEAAWALAAYEVCSPANNGIARRGGIAGMFNDCVLLMPHEYNRTAQCPRGEARVAANFH